MRLLVIKRLQWAVLGTLDERGTCAVAQFLRETAAGGGVEASQVQALIVLVAQSGPPRNERRSRHLDGPIYELKTRSGIRIPYFYDEGRVVICTEALQKPKPAELRRVIERAKALHADYMRAKQQGHLETVEEEG